MRSLFIVVFILFTTSVLAQKDQVIIPNPQCTSYSSGEYVFPSNMKVFFDPACSKSLQNYVLSEMAESVGIKAEPSQSNKADLIFVNNANIKEEGYQLIVSKRQLVIKSSGQAGWFYGFQSVLQLMLQNSKDRKITCCTIDDYPRFRWRGLMVDESRHFFGKEKMKEVLDFMALLKLNKFHWHLTDEPGWRIEIKQYPLLTAIGGQGTWGDPNAPVHYYTQENIREIVAYAAERFIEIIPEIDMPGHASAANLAYPQFSGGGNEAHPHFTFNPGMEASYQYLTNILREVTGLFPSDYIHLGGDEVHFANQQWADIPEVQELMEQENLENLIEVEHYFLNRMVDSLKVLGKKMVGWDEVSTAGIKQEDGLVMWWRHDKPQVLDNLLKQEYTTILTPRIPMYLDFDQHESNKWGRRWQGFSDLPAAHAFPDSLSSPIGESSVLGIQASLWTERIASEERFDYMLWPRLLAVSEAAWTNAKAKDFTQFESGLSWFLPYLGKMGIYYFNPFDPQSTPEPEGVSKARWQKNHETDKK